MLVLAATLPLDRVLVGESWRNAAWGAVAVALVLSVIGQALRWRLVTTGVVSAVAWAWVTTSVFLDGGGVLPSPRQLGELATVVEGGLDAVIREPAPAPPLEGLLILVWTGCWWMTQTVHTLVSRLRYTGPGIVAAAVLWAFPLAIPHPPSGLWPAVPAFLGAALLLLLIDPDPDLRGWRRQTRRGWVPAAAGTVLGAGAILVGTIGPGVAPGYGEEPWLDIRAGQQTRGYQPIVDVSRRLKLPTPRDLLLVETDRPVYLRLAGLDAFDGGVWRLGQEGDTSFRPSDVVPADRPLPLESPIGISEDVTVTVENLALENVFVPAPYHPLRVEGPSARRMVFSPDGSFLATSETTEGEPALLPGMTYAVESAIPSPPVEALAQLDHEAYVHPSYQRWTDVPSEFPELRAVTAQVARRTGAETPAEIAFALQEHFRSDRFTYSLDVPPLRSEDELVQFVMDRRTGYCEQFATAMAVMLRLENIPARVAVGFRLGDEVDPGRYVITSDHAHAWVEVLFPGAGWVAFEPTPSLGDTLVPTTGDISPDIPLAEAEEQAAEEETPHADDPEEPTPTGDEDEEPEAAAEEQADGGSEEAPVEPAPGRTVPAALVLTALVAGAVLLARRSRTYDEDEEVDVGVRVLQAQQRLFDAARSHGVGRSPSETAHEVVHRWSDEDRVGPSEAARFAEIVQAAAFGGGIVEQDTAGEAEHLSRSLASDLRGSVSTSDRIVAPVRGTVLRARDAGEELANEARVAWARSRERN
jgi:hypothetical protein